MKHCNKCNTTKPLSQFHKRGDKHKAWCKPCSNSYSKERYKKDPKRREFEIADMRRGMSWSRLKKEIDKCQVLCANCHSIKTANQLNNWKLKWLAR